MAKKSEPRQPTPPNPKEVAEAQTGSNVNTAIANSVIGNANQVGPMGSTTYDQTGSYSMAGPDGQTYQIPRYTQTTTLSPEQQQLYNQQTQLGSSLNNLAQGQVGRLGDVLGKPVDTSSLPQLDDLTSTQGRQRVEDALFQRLNPQLERDRNSLENNLTNQGFQRGTEAFTNAMDQFGRQSNDARLAVTAQGLGEQQGLFGMQQANRQRGLQEMLALRNQPINEISALMSGGQVSLPGVQQYNAPNVANTSVGDYMYNTAGLQNQQWQTQAQMQAARQNALIGAIGGVAGAGMYGLGGGKLWGGR